VIYTVILEKYEIDFAGLKQQISEIKDFDATIMKRKTEMKQSIDFINKIISSGAISETHLRIMVDKVMIF